MRLPSDYRFTSAIKDQSRSTTRKRRIKKNSEEEFGEELEETMYQKQSELEKKITSR